MVLLKYKKGGQKVCENCGVTAARKSCFSLHGGLQKVWLCHPCIFFVFKSPLLAQQALELKYPIFPEPRDSLGKFCKMAVAATGTSRVEK